MTCKCHIRSTSVACVIGIAMALGSSHGWAQEDFDRDPINYTASTPDNAVTALEKRLKTGQSKLEYETHFGYLHAVLRELALPQSSQMLVFSKTSMQRQRITPQTPRAIYFNDEVYVGFCQQGEVMEISAIDPQLGVVFYTLDQARSDAPRFVRQGDSCLICHASSSTQGVPGLVVRSVYSDPEGLPILSAGTYRIDQTSPLAQRWGGWYVTGRHGDQKHLGNLVIAEKEVPREVDNRAGLNATDLRDRFDATKYVTPDSDLVALMVFEHQVQAHNLITKANFACRQALYAQRQLNLELKEPLDHVWASTTSRIRGAGDALVKYLLFAGEAPLTGKLAGTSSFTNDFQAMGPRDAQGRSLRDFDLEKRLFRYPCSYLVYSRSFDSLPPEMSEYVLGRIYAILTGKETKAEFAHLGSEDRQAILEILRETKPNLPEYWHSDTL
jgi:hypothetical protein